MKRIVILIGAFMLYFSAATYAQVSTTPEVPRNYKPKPKDLLPMPAGLTDQDIFPVLGGYSVTKDMSNASKKEIEKANQDAQAPADIALTITKDATNNGIVWVNGLPQGKFKAYLKAAPTTYMIPAQKTMINDIQMASTTDSTGNAVANFKGEDKFSGKSISEGTLIFDSASQKIYINLGTKFNEEHPIAAFPALEEAQAANNPVTTTSADGTATTVTTVKHENKKGIKGVTYTGTKTTAATAMLQPAAQQ